MTGMVCRLEELTADTPASQTLIVLSFEPDTMVDPSGEKATDITMPLCALCFSALSSKDAATSTEAVRSGLRGQGCQLSHTCIPDFDRLVLRAGHDGRAIGGKGHGHHPVAVRALLLRLELQGSCIASMGALSFGPGEEYGGLRYTCIPDFDRLVP